MSRKYGVADLKAAAAKHGGQMDEVQQFGVVLRIGYILERFI